MKGYKGVLTAKAMKKPRGWAFNHFRFSWLIFSIDLFLCGAAERGIKFATLFLGLKVVLIYPR